MEKGRRRSGRDTRSGSRRFFEDGIKDDGGRRGEGLAARWTLHYVEDETRFGNGAVGEWRGAFARLVDEEVIPEGLDQDLCLVADRNAVDSLMRPGLRKTSHLLAVCREEPEVRDGGDGDEPVSLGHFKVALRAVVPQLWVMLNAMSAEELDPGVGYIWNELDAIPDRP